MKLCQQYVKILHLSQPLYFSVAAIRWENNTIRTLALLRDESQGKIFGENLKSFSIHGRKARKSSWSSDSMSQVKIQGIKIVSRRLKNVLASRRSQSGDSVLFVNVQRLPIASMPLLIVHSEALPP